MSFLFLLVLLTSQCYMEKKAEFGLHELKSGNWFTGKCIQSSPYY